jgi:hypothetical protein
MAKALLLVLLLVSLANAFKQLANVRNLKKFALKMNKESSLLNQNWLRNVVASTLMTSSIFTSNYVLTPSEIQIDMFRPVVAVADFRAQQKSTFFRFSPKLVTGRDYFRSNIKNAIEKEDWEIVKKFFELYPSKINKNDPKQVDAFDSYINSNLYRPMKVLAGSFAERASTDKQRALVEQEAIFEEAMQSLEGKLLPINKLLVKIYCTIRMY